MRARRGSLLTANVKPVQRCMVREKRRPSSNGRHQPLTLGITALLHGPARGRTRARAGSTR